MIDPLDRWREYGEKPDYAGLLTFGGLPYTEDPAELAGIAVAVIGAPTDDLVSDRPGTRFGPRAIRAASCPPGPHLEAKVDAFAVLRMVDFGDAPVVPADPARSLAAIEATVAQVLAAGAIPIVLGGDHSIAEPDIRACAAARGPVGLVHFDTHTDTGTQVFGVEVSHGTPMYRLVEEGAVDPMRYVQIGLRGYWPGEAEFAWQKEKGITSFFAHDVRRLGIEDVIKQTLAIVGKGVVFLIDRRGRARPRLCAGNRHARARRPHPGGAALGRADGRRQARGGRSGRRRGDPDSGRLGRHHGARRRPDRARGDDRDRAAPPLGLEVARAAPYFGVLRRLPSQACGSRFRAVASASLRAEPACAPWNPSPWPKRMCSGSRPPRARRGGARRRNGCTPNGSPRARK